MTRPPFAPTVSGTPATLQELGKAAPGAADDLRRRGRRLADGLDHWNGSTTGAHQLRETAPSATRHLAALLEELDGWAGQVGIALELADLQRSHPFGMPGPGGVWLPPWSVRLDVPLVDLAPGLLDVAVATDQVGALGEDVLARIDREVLASAGRRPGLSTADRDRLNRAALLQVRAQLEGRPSLSFSEQARLASLVSLEERWGDAQVLTFRPDDGPDGEPTLQVLVGDLEGATSVAVWVPGTTHGLHTLDEDLGVAVSLRQAVASLDRQAAVLVDLYDAPDTLPRARHAGFGRHHADDLVAAVSDLRRLADDARVVVVGHSYGSYVAGRAAAAGMGADALVLVGTPGVGETRVTALATEEVWVARAPQDPIDVAADADEHLFGSSVPGLRRFALGPDPADPDFGARAFEVNPAGLDPDDPTWVHGHSDYLAPGTRSLENIARIVAGLAPTEPRRDDVPRRLRAVDGPGWGASDRLVPLLDPEWWVGSDGTHG